MTDLKISTAQKVLRTQGDFPPCQPSLPGHYTVCKTVSVRQTFFSTACSDSQAFRKTWTLSKAFLFFNTHSFHSAIRSFPFWSKGLHREGPREQPVLSNPGQIATHSLSVPSKGQGLLPHSTKCTPKTTSLPRPIKANRQTSMDTYFFPAQAQLDTKGVQLPWKSTADTACHESYSPDHPSLPLQPLWILILWNLQKGSLDHLLSLRYLKECSKRGLQRTRKETNPRLALGTAFLWGFWYPPWLTETDFNWKGRMLSTPREIENEVSGGHIWRQLWNSDKYF